MLSVGLLGRAGALGAAARFGGRLAVGGGWGDSAVVASRLTGRLENGGRRDEE